MWAILDGGLKRFFIAAAVLVLAAGGPACKRKPAPGESSAGASPTEPGGVVLQVGGSTYRAGDFARYVSATVGVNWQKLGAVTLTQFFDKFVDDKLLLQAAVDGGITLTPEEKVEMIRKLKEEGWTPEEENAALTSDSGPLAERMKVEKYTAGLVKGLSVSDEEVRAYYESNKSQFFLPERVKVSQILLTTEPKAVDVWEKLRGASEDEFRSMAKIESAGPEAAEGGQMGVFQKGQLPAELETAALSLEPGEISSILESSYGFHILRLDEKYAAEQTSLEDASSTIRVNLLDQKARAVVARRLLDLRESLDWTTYPANLPFAYEKVER